MSRVALGAAAVVGALFATATISRARAQDFDDVLVERRSVESPERFALELRVGPYTPEVGNSSFTDTFGNDTGPLLAAEFDVLVWHIPYVGPIGIGGGIGWVDYTASAFAQGSTDRVTTETDLSLVPISLVAVLRIDVLARKLNIPFVLTGKIGADYVLWDSNVGSTDSASGGSFGLRWAAQLAFELDFFDRRAARSLDEEWGINHSWLFVEVFGSDAGGDSLPVGDTTWAVGLGFTF